MFIQLVDWILGCVGSLVHTLVVAVLVIIHVVSCFRIIDPSLPVCIVGCFRGGKATNYQLGLGKVK